MKLWILKARTGLDKDDNPWDNPYDCYHGFVIRATSEAHAREMAHATEGDESRSHRAWIDPKYSTCEELTSDGPTNIILTEGANG